MISSGSAFLSRQAARLPTTVNCLSCLTHQVASRTTMLFTKFVALLALPILAVATPMPGDVSPTETMKSPTITVTVTTTATETESVSQCNTGPVMCCNEVQKASSESVTSILGLLGVVLQDLDVLIGLTCDPLSILGISGCSAAPLCCENNTFNGLIAIGCVPITINL